ncbi:hypothetical protein AOT96_00025 [Rhodococcus sp. 008]|nr:hypothetical protein AOT96_00025 [Rhodococcus sp. 008]
MLLDLEMQAYCESQENDGIFRLSKVSRESTTETAEADIAELVRVGRWEILPKEGAQLARLTYWDLDSGDGGQRTSDQVRATRNADRIRAACSRGNHSECPETKWCRKEKTSRRDSRKDSRGNSRKESDRREGEGREVNNTSPALSGQNLDSPAPGGAARPEPTPADPSEAGAPVADDEPPSKPWEAII